MNEILEQALPFWESLTDKQKEEIRNNMVKQNAKRKRSSISAAENAPESRSSEKEECGYLLHHRAAEILHYSVCWKEMSVF